MPVASGLIEINAVFMLNEIMKSCFVIFADKNRRRFICCFIMTVYNDRIQMTTNNLNCRCMDAEPS